MTQANGGTAFDTTTAALRQRLQEKRFPCPPGNLVSDFERTVLPGSGSFRPLVAGALCWLGASGCAAAPSPLTPQWVGSIGAPGRGVLTGGRQVRAGPGLKWLRANDRRWALPRFAQAIERAAAEVDRERPGATLSVGDLSGRSGGGPALPHFSHRSGIDADLLFYMTTLEGAPVASPGFIHVGADGLAQDGTGGRWLRFDVEREWLLVKALVEDPEARVEWIFVSDVVKARLLEWAAARGEFTETLYRAITVMAQPARGGVHDDHIHVRTACSPEEVVAGCEPTGPVRPWLRHAVPDIDESTGDLVAALFEPSPSFETTGIGGPKLP
jgi:penicillin-insensitive murein endopeptidase